MLLDLYRLLSPIQNPLLLQVIFSLSLFFFLRERTPALAILLDLFVLHLAVARFFVFWIAVGRWPHARRRRELRYLHRLGDILLHVAKAREGDDLAHLCRWACYWWMGRGPAYFRGAKAYSLLGRLPLLRPIKIHQRQKMKCFFLAGRKWNDLFLQEKNELKTKKSCQRRFKHSEGERKAKWLHNGQKRRELSWTNADQSIHLGLCFVC